VGTVRLLPQAEDDRHAERAQAVATPAQYESNSPFVIRSIPVPNAVVTLSPLPFHRSVLIGNEAGWPNETIGTTRGPVSAASARVDALGQVASQPYRRFRIPSACRAASRSPSRR
jgi:hypothetical protein